MDTRNLWHKKRLILFLERLFTQANEIKSIMYMGKK
jgi:hypothetical protein